MVAPGIKPSRIQALGTSRRIKGHRADLKCIAESPGRVLTGPGIKQRLSVERLKALAWEVEVEDCPHPGHGHDTGNACGLMLLQALQD
jgi:hypothetical protein